jgi:hypothetical protein
MAALVPFGGAPPVPVVAPHLPFVADPSTIKEWLLNATLTGTSSSVLREMEQGLSRLVNNIPEFGDAGHDEQAK